MTRLQRRRHQLGQQGQHAVAMGVGVDNGRRRGREGLPGTAGKNHSCPIVRMVEALGEKDLLFLCESRHEGGLGLAGLGVGSHQLVRQEPHLSAQEGLLGGLQGLILGQAELEEAIELDEEGGGGGVVHLPEGAEAAAGAGLEGHADETELALLIAEGGEAAAHGDEFEGMAAVAGAQAPA